MKEGNKMKKIIGLMICMLLLSTACVKNDNGGSGDSPTPPQNTPSSNEIGGIQVVDGVEFSGMKLDVEGETTNITLNIRNISNSPINLSVFEIELFNDEGALAFGIQVGGQIIPAGETWEWTTNVGLPLDHAETVGYKVTLGEIPTDTIVPEEE